MKLSNAIAQLLHKQQKQKDTILSVLLDVEAVVIAAWQQDGGGSPHILGTAREVVSVDSWDARTEACDRALSQLDKTLDTRGLSKVVLGLPSVYLTTDNGILPAVRPHLKKLMTLLELAPLGFVPLTQAIIYKLKHDEGVPPSVILLEVGTTSATVTVYKVGTHIGQKTIEVTPDTLVGNVESAIKTFKELEVLPSRILVYGLTDVPDEAKAQLLRHPWTTRANFLHFPKIDRESAQEAIAAVSLAGARELAASLGDMPQEEVPQKEESLPPSDKQSIPLSQDSGEPAEQEMRTDELLSYEGETEEPNVTAVEPEKLGFHRDMDILEARQARQEGKPPKATEASEDTTRSERTQEFEKFEVGSRLPRMSLSALTAFFPSFLSGRLIVPVLLTVLLIIGVAYGITWLFPRAIVTVYVLPSKIKETSSVQVDPTSSIVDADNAVIPGRKREQTVSGEKTIDVAGKKDVGDPSKGAVVLYNKSLSAKTFKKGTILTSGSLSFTLDDEVRVASASESIGSITFGKASANITAVAIGPQSNLPPSTEFTFKDTAVNVAIARNDQVLSGGTSKEVTVVSRADQEKLVGLLTDELVVKAKADLAGSVGGGEKLIDETIKTSISDKQFTEELDQEANKLHGKITVGIGGISYGEADVVSLMRSLAERNVPAGYVLAQESLAVSLRDVQIKKDGKIVAQAQLDAKAFPSIDASDLRARLRGKTIDEVKRILEATRGVAGVAFDFRFSIFPKRMPINPNNISVSFAEQE